MWEGVEWVVGEFMRQIALVGFEIVYTRAEKMILLTFVFVESMRPNARNLSYHAL